MNANYGNFRRGISEFRLSSRAVRQLKTVVLALACMAAMGSAQAEDGIGSVKDIRGSAVIVRNGADLPAAIGTPVQQGDLLRTAENSSAKVSLADGTQVTVGPSSQVSLESFAFNAGNQKGNLLVGILKGTMRMVSGLIAKSNPGNAMIRTPTATAGIRGTDFIVDVP